MKYVDTNLARRMEAAEDVPQVEIARVLQRTHPEVGADILEIAGGHAVFAGLNSPVGRAIGLGFDGAVSAAQLDEVEAFYKQHNAPSAVDITPVTHGSLLELLKKRGYVLAELNNVMARKLEPHERFEESVPGVEFRACATEETTTALPPRRSTSPLTVNRRSCWGAHPTCNDISWAEPFTCPCFRKPSA